MKRFKVKSLHVGGLGNKVFKSGDIVTERNFPAGNADKLVKSGHLEFHDEVADYVPVEKSSLKEGAARFEMAIKQSQELFLAGDVESAKAALEEARNINPDSEVVKQAFEQIAAKEAAENALNSPDGGDGKKDEDIIDDGTVKPYDDIDESELKEILKKRGVNFSENSKKKFLYKLYSENASK